jgi:hypothetical protein
MYRIIFLLAISLGLVACSNNDKKVSGWEINDVYHSTIITPNPANNSKSYQGPPINSMDEANTYQMFSIRGDRSNQGVKTFEVLAQLTYFSQWRYYDSASLKGSPLNTFKVVSREAGACSERGCIFRELLSISITEAFLKEYLDKGFQISLNAKSGNQSILYIPPQYIKGYLMAVDGSAK